MKIRDIPTETLREELRTMKRTDTLYKLIKSELEHRGNWKQAPRGKGFHRGDDPRRKKDALASKPKPVFNDLFSR